MGPYEISTRTSSLGQRIKQRNNLVICCKLILLGWSHIPGADECMLAIAEGISRSTLLAQRVLRQMSVILLKRIA